MLKVVNNFLGKEYFSPIDKLLISPHFAWFATDGVTKDYDGGFFLVHILFFDGKINSDFFHTIMQPIIDKLKIKKLIRAKVNLYPATYKKEEHGYHVDFPEKHRVALFYLNTNNGKTLFKNKAIKAVKNRLVLFDGDKEHASTSCTDQPYRITLNINYDV
tara:strand:- start:45 stop:524 length:480 start_codon:yes stop_codon:yes gene_type:complete